ncbi:MAG TPA: SRPBCC family protein [Nitrospiraceae bacterium]|nr:SRPBCC family protein [Nitrospiraceae bacterium]
MPTIEACIDVHVPVQTAYDQWRAFEKFPQFMNGVKQSSQTNPHRLHWKTEIAGKRVVIFKPISDVMSTVVLQWACTHEGHVEHRGDGVGASSLRIQKELKRFKTFVESCHQVTGDWLAYLPYHAFP